MIWARFDEIQDALNKAKTPAEYMKELERKAPSMDGQIKDLPIDDSRMTRGPTLRVTSHVCSVHGRVVWRMPGR